MKQAQDAIMVFRCGHNGLIRLNFKQTIDFYNSTVSGDSLTNTGEVKWRKAEFTFNYDTQEITFYYNNANDDSVTVPFYYSKLESANGLMLYNLKPGSTSYFKELIVSSDIPENRASSRISRMGIALLLLITPILTLK